MANFKTFEGKVTPNDVGKYKGAKISDVRKVVHGWPAAVESNFFPFGI